MAEYTVFGVRHHGPGSAASLLNALNNLQPDIVLVEGPPDAEAVLSLASHHGMRPPVALLIYALSDLKKASFFPFAVFSPEWQAFEYANHRHIPIRFIDLPQTYQFMLDEEEPATEEELAANPELRIRIDPLGELAQAAGFSDGERWWERMIEHRQDSTDLFEAVLEAMTALRITHNDQDDPRNQLREAWMRKSIRAAMKEGFQNIAVVCGAWHAPALIEMPAAKEDQDLLKGLKKIPVSATWIPWTHGRLTMMSGYGAGVWSPGWYQHLWEHDKDIASAWLTKVARLLREEDLSASTAQIIDAVELAQSLAAMRGLPIPSLAEFNDAALTVFCHANDKPMQLIFDKLIVGETIGTVPHEAPMLPIQRDLETQQKHLRMMNSPSASTLNLDLRKPFHLERSHLLHRLQILNIPWGKKEDTSDKAGTFHEVWTLQWQPELTIRIIERGIWGNTIETAAVAYAHHLADDSLELPALTGLVREVLLADLPNAIARLVTRLQEATAVTGDVTLLMQSLPALADVLTYGNVRKTDASMVDQVVDGMVVRVTIGLPSAVASLADDTAREMFNLILHFQSAIRLLDNPTYQEAWQGVLRKLTNQEGVHGLIQGRACRILLDMQQITLDETTTLMRLGISQVGDQTQSAAWIEGFLQGSGLILLHDDKLLQVIDDWVMSLDGEVFEALLPLLRRTFATFDQPERKEIGRKIKQIEVGQPDSQVSTVLLDEERANAVLPTLALLLGIKDYNHDGT